MAITEFQERVYTSLLAIPRGKVCSYATLAKSLSTSPRAVGGALRNNPYAPEVPCHRVIASDGYVGGFMGDWQKAPSSINQTKKLDLLAEEGVYFDGQGRLVVITSTSTSATTTTSSFKSTPRPQTRTLTKTKTKTQQQKHASTLLDQADGNGNGNHNDDNSDNDPWFNGPWDLEAAKTKLVEIMTTKRERKDDF
ncbi:hypothetical protein PV08_11777 [Exophiala spinifera]|uniref:Methylated-DNA--protein-cysteine methyltransferase n=1 Tax=Exophiala spinifera TaxID=91928 RepID=A0A0D1Y523_9EURO|nr:uncharacterized protein PV08_11777 [Exophiala spinifera]KIW10001.1 hypothetical protein PV08_11777 [Exophiala spinifera]